MKAICNGDREVGKMLYSLAVTFRSQLKEADVITLMQELHYCKKYLELFEYRYQEKSRSSVECGPDLRFRLSSLSCSPLLRIILSMESGWRRATMRFGSMPGAWRRTSISM